MQKMIHWSNSQENVIQTAVELFLEGDKAIVSPTKVGYIITTIDAGGLKKKFALKNRPSTKPGVVLCSSVQVVKQLAQTNEQIDELYQQCYDKDILLGCILPWKPEEAKKYLPVDATSMVQDPRKTSCFVIRFGAPSEKIVKELWEKHHKLVFASSANPSGQGNRGRIEGIGEQIANGADLIIEADEFVKAQQPDKSTETRYEQGVMVSMVDDNAKLLDVPVVIRKGLDVEKIMLELSKIYKYFDYRHGQYY
ncbi:MAG: Sua5/YciO/YrdC/YwlC family protein [Patescibacteria group bacterium]